MIEKTRFWALMRMVRTNETSRRVSRAFSAVCLLAVGLAGCEKKAPKDEETEVRPRKSVTSQETNKGNTQPTIIPTPPITRPTAALGAPQSLQPLVQSTGPAVVTIKIKGKSRRGRSIQRGLGSGFLIDKKGTILTNNHVVEGGTAIEIVLTNDKTVEGKIVGTDPCTDVAVVQIDPPSGVEPIALGDSDAIAVGDWVMAIGNPLGLSHTVTSGILSAKGRTTKDVPIKSKSCSGNEYFDFLQTDAAINPGNSGGPLLNMKGEVIGINTAINAAGQGLAFAIPINMVKEMLPSLVKEGRVVRSYLGVGIDDMPLDEKTGVRGAKVFKVYKHTPADKAGLKSGDHLVAIDGVPIRDSAQLRWRISIAGPGRKVNLRMIRAERPLDLPVTLEEVPKRPLSTDDEEEESSE